jgi:cob(I)alamin adenosyltransferase
MKFSTKGDGGETSLLGGQRVSKHDDRPEAYGTLDEASSVLGVARAMTKNASIAGLLLAVQKDLLVIGAELAALPEDVARLGHRIGGAEIRRLEEQIDRLQEDVQLKNEFVYPGASPVSAQIDVGRTVIRRAERRAAWLKERGMVDNEDIHRYLNRLADLLFVLARFEEGRE